VQADENLHTLEEKNIALAKHIDSKDFQISQLAAATILLKKTHASAMHDLKEKHAERVVESCRPNEQLVVEANLLRVQLACLLPEVRYAEHERRLHEIESEEVHAELAWQLPSRSVPSCS
jgi:hypothetical protein